MLNKKDRQLMYELIIKMEQQDYLSGKFEERGINKFMVSIFKKILKNLK
ncbi:hypothetical protein JZO73_08045 [Enterococcus plantarum]|nr:hypothetical protein [Enterococcus plantarum]MBO0467487.1 hypothetical protein [Enterococcus plantarum]